MSAGLWATLSLVRNFANLELDVPFFHYLTAKTTFMPHIAPTANFAAICEGIKGSVVGSNACYISNCSGIYRNIGFVLI
jgi:hypothetical protein